MGGWCMWRGAFGHVGVDRAEYHGEYRGGEILAVLVPGFHAWPSLEAENRLCGALVECVPWVLNGCSP